MVTLLDTDCWEQERPVITPVRVHQFCNWLLLQSLWEEGVRRIRQCGSAAHAQRLPDEEPQEADAQRCPWPRLAWRSAVWSAVGCRRLTTAVHSRRLTRDRLRQLTLPFR